MIRAGVGLSTDRRSRQAAEESVGIALEGLGGSRPDWCVAFVTADYRARLPALLSTLASASGTPYVVGCSAAGVLVSGTEVETGPSVGVLAVASDRLRGTPFLFQDNGDHGLAAGVHVGQRLVSSRGTRDLVLLWPDPFHVRPDRLLQGLDATLAGVPVAGAAASTRGTVADGTFQFCGEETARGAVSGLRLGGTFRHRVELTQGCRPLGSPRRVTRSHENLVLEVDGVSALDALREVAPRGLLDDLDRALHQVFVGLLPDSRGGAKRSRDYLVRNIVAVDPDTGVLAIADTVEEGEHIVFTLREPSSAEEDLKGMLLRLKERSTGAEYRFGLYFNCLARGRSLYRREGVDAGLLRSALPDLPLLGFFCNCEMAPLNGVNQLFTYTGVLVLVAD